MFILDFHYWRFTPRQSLLKPTTLGSKPRGVWLFRLALLIGIVLGAMVLIDLARELQYRLQGVEIQGRILECAEQRVNETVYYDIQVVYQYNVSDTLYTGRDYFTATTQNRCDDLRNRGTIPIQYLAPVPAQSVFYAYRWRYRDLFEIWTARIAAVVLIAPSVWGLWHHHQFYARLRRLNQESVLLPGVITWAKDTFDGEKGGYQVTFEYLFINPAGYEINATTHGLLRDSRPFGLPRPGLIVSVLYAGDDCYVVL